MHLLRCEHLHRAALRCTEHVSTSLYVSEIRGCGAWRDTRRSAAPRRPPAEPVYAHSQTPAAARPGVAVCAVSQGEGRPGLRPNARSPASARLWASGARLRSTPRGVGVPSTQTSSDVEGRSLGHESRERVDTYLCSHCLQEPCTAKTLGCEASELTGPRLRQCSPARGLG